MERHISVRPTGHCGSPSKLVPNVPIGPNRNGPFHLMYQPKLPEFWVEWKAPQVKTIEKVPLGLRKWLPRTLNRGRNYSTSREVSFGTLKADHLRTVPTIVTAHIFCACQGSCARRERNAQQAGHADWFCLL